MGDMSTIIVTGASRGIGLATALVLARSGHSVHATMRKPSASPELADIASAEKLPVQIHSMDVDSDVSVAETFAGILKLGPADVLVNNAGVERVGPIEETPLADFRLCMETNYFGMLRCVQAVARHMRERGSGSIVNVTSVAGRIAMAPMAAYAASKYAAEALSECLAQEMKPFGVRVHVIRPGIIDTRMARNIEVGPKSSIYRQPRRVAAMFEASLEQSRPASIVGEKIREVIESGTWQFRHLAGPDAAPFLAWRESMTDEQWTEWNAMDDQAWLAAMKRDFGMDLKLGA